MRSAKKKNTSAYWEYPVRTGDLHKDTVSLDATALLRHAMQCYRLIAWQPSDVSVFGRLNPRPKAAVPNNPEIDCGFAKAALGFRRKLPVACSAKCSGAINHDECQLVQCEVSSGAQAVGQFGASIGHRALLGEHSPNLWAQRTSCSKEFLCCVCRL